MREVVDLYAKLLIGTFSFIGPSFTLLIPLFYDAILKAKQRHAEKIYNLQLIIGRQQHQDLLSGTTSELKEFQKRLKENQNEINLLNPKRQVRRLFIPLLFAILFVIFYYFQRSSFWPLNYQAIRIVTIGVSLVLFGYCLFVLWQIFCTITRIKQEERQQQKQQQQVPLKRLSPHSPKPSSSGTHGTV